MQKIQCYKSKMGRKKTYDRDEVLAKAMNCFWKNGFEGTHLSMLVDATSLNRFSLYKEFGGKEGLFEESLQHFFDWGCNYSLHLDRKPYGIDNIRSYFLDINFDADYYGCFMVSTLGEKHVISTKAFEMAKSFSKQVELSYLKNLKAAKSRGDIDQTTDLPTLAKLLLTFDQGLSVYGISQPNNQDKNQMVHIMLNHLCGK